MPGNADLDREVAVDQVVLLEAAETLADLAGPNGADALHLLQVALRGADDRVEPVERRDDAPDHALREPRDVREHREAARRHRVVERVHARRIAEHREQLELEQILVGQRRERLEALPRPLLAALGVVVGDDRPLLARDVPDELLELHADQAALAAELDAVARSEEHTSELQSPCNLVCRLLLEKKNINTYIYGPLRVVLTSHD